MRLRLFMIPSHMAQQTTFSSFLGVAVVLLMFGFCVDGRICTRMTLTKKQRTETVVAECINSYQERCTWFSTEICVFNETVPCVKHFNKTYDLYRVVEDCCPGYQRDKDNNCISDSSSKLKEQGVEMTSQGQLTSERPGVEKSQGELTSPQQDAEKMHGDLTSPQQDAEKMHGDLTSLKPDVEKTVTEASGSAKETGGVKAGHVSTGDDGKFFLGISPGAYAGIVCGILFITCVAFLSAINYRKRRLRQAKMNTMNFEQEVAQKQQMIPIGPLESADPPPSPTVNT